MAMQITEVEIKRLQKDLARYLFVDADHVELTDEQVRSIECLALLERQFERDTHEGVLDCSGL